MKYNNIYKFGLIIISNVLIFAFLFFIFNEYVKKNVGKIFVTNYINKEFQNKSYKNFPEENSIYPYEDNRLKTFLEFNKENLNKFCGENRKIFGEQYKKRPIIIFGCSYTYGHGLKTNESFPYLLSELTKRPVYNFARCGSDLTASFDDFVQQYNYESTQDYREKINDTEYVIYIYMHDHMARYLNIDKMVNMYNEVFPASSFEKFLLKFKLTAYIMCDIRRHQITKTIKGSENFLKTILKLYINKTKKILNNSPSKKFIIILYNEKICKELYTYTEIASRQQLINSDFWKDLEKEENIQVVKTKDIMGFYFNKDYKLEEDISDWHPNARVWREFTPRFAVQYIK